MAQARVTEGSTARLNELCEISDAGILELVERIVQRDEQPIVEAIDALANVKSVVHNVAERLLTGRAAEEYFFKHSRRVLRVAADDLLDCRLLARGYDFGVRDRPDWAIEVKGLKRKRGDILFTDREWTEAAERTEN